MCSSDLLVPQLEGGKNTIVDVLCTDARGRKFCVEMQMEWSDAFKQRVLFNASKFYVSQAKKGGKYSELQPVYSLNLVNDIFAHDTPDFIHNYRIVHDKDSSKVIKGLHFTFIEQVGRNLLRVGIDFREETEPQDHHALIGNRMRSELRELNEGEV